MHNNTSTKQKDFMILSCILIAVFVVPTSISGTAIALPAISQDLHSDSTTLQWIVNAFNLTFASFTLAWGGISDVFGSKRSFISGIILYLIASIFSACSGNIIILDISRALAGIGGAAVFACGSAILIQSFDGPRRTHAFALFGTTAGLGITFGPTISGWLLDSLGWQYIFIIHAVALFIVLVLSFNIASPVVAGNQKHSLDIWGILIFIVTLFLLMTGVSTAAEYGWTNSKAVITLLSGIVFLLLFIITEKRAHNPVINFSMLKNYNFLSVIMVPVVASFSFVTLLTWFPTWLLSVMNLSPLYAGITMLALTSPVLFLPFIAGKLATSGVDIKRILIISLILFVVGIVLLWTFTDNENATLPSVVVSLFLIGSGMGLSAGLVDGAALGMVSQNETGRAAGILNTFRLGSEAIAVAVYGSLMTMYISSLLSSAPASTTQKTALSDIVSGKVFTVPDDVDKSILMHIYTLAFNRTIFVIGLITVILSFFIITLIKINNKKN